MQIFSPTPSAAEASAPSQQDLFEQVVAIYRDHDAAGATELDNERLYASLSIDTKEQQPIGKRGVCYSVPARQVRWSQQTAKRLGLIERVPGKRGVWRLAASATSDKTLTPAPDGVALVAFSTALGLAIWTSNETMTPRLTEEIHAVITSPPYPLANARAYGNPTAAEFVDFICRSLEPLLKNLVPGGVIALNVSNDVFVKGTPARSSYIERMVVALEDRLGLHLYARDVWHNKCKPPGPTYWACRTRQQLRVAYEPIIVFTNDPINCRADNRRVLQPHSEAHLKLMAAGGEKRNASYGDGAYKLRAGTSFANVTAGRIPTNVYEFTHHSREVQATRRAAAELGLPKHGALLPVDVAKRLVEFLTRRDDLVVDLWSGWNTVGLAAEQTGRRWLAFERMAQYNAGAALRFQDCEGFHSSFDIDFVDVDGVARTWPASKVAS